MEIDSVFHIPVMQSIQDATPVADTVGLSSCMPVKIVSKVENETISYNDIYAEINSASEEVMRCRNAILDNIC